MPGPRPLRPGEPQRLGEYRLLARIGEGGQGVVYLAENAAGDRVAIKVLHPHVARDAEARERFLREVDAAMRVAPFCTARVLDVAVDGDRPYVVSEYVEGVSLEELVRTQGPRVPGALDRIAVGTVTALAAIHKAGIAHRDFKPSNVLLGPDGPRVIDFGIARALDISTAPGLVIGTPAYMSPEQLSGLPVGTAADVFSWALTMAFAATGVPPFGEDNHTAVMYRIVNSRPRLDGVPQPLRSVLERCLAKEADERPTSAQVLDMLLGQGGAGASGYGQGTGGGTRPRGAGGASVAFPGDVPGGSASRISYWPKARPARPEDPPGPRSAHGWPFGPLAVSLTLSVTLVAAARAASWFRPAGR